MDVEWFIVGCDDCNGVTIWSDRLTKTTTTRTFLQNLTSARQNTTFSRIYTPQEIVPQIMNDNYEIYDEEGIEEIEEKSLHQHSYG